MWHDMAPYLWSLEIKAFIAVAGGFGGPLEIKAFIAVAGGFDGSVFPGGWLFYAFINKVSFLKFV